VLAAAGAWARSGFGAARQAGALRDPFCAGAWRPAATSPSIPKTDGKRPWQNVCGPWEQRGPDRGGTGEGQQNGHHDPPANPRFQQLSQLAPKLQALIAAHGGGICGVLALCLHARAANQKRCGPALVDFRRQPQL